MSFGIIADPHSSTLANQANQAETYSNGDAQLTNLMDDFRNAVQFQISLKNRIRMLLKEREEEAQRKEDEAKEAWLMAQREKEALKTANLRMEEKLRQTESIVYDEGNKSCGHLEVQSPSFPPPCGLACKESSETALAGTQHGPQDEVEPTEVVDEMEVVRIPAANILTKTDECACVSNGIDPNAVEIFFTGLLTEADEAENKANAARIERQPAQGLQRKKLDKKIAILEREAEILRMVVERWKNLTSEHKSPLIPAFDS